MQILLVSRSWPSNERSGVSLVAAEHARMLTALGHAVAIVGASIGVRQEQLDVVARYHVPASGSGALYAPVKVDPRLVASIIGQARPDLIVVEAWQTALTDAFVESGAASRIPVLMISHGVTIDPVSRHPLDILRSWAWRAYASKRLPRMISGLAAMATLDLVAQSKRFVDRDIALSLGIKVVELPNAPIHLATAVLGRRERHAQILVIGYYSRLKNQLAALSLAATLKSSKVRFKFVGPKSGSYYRRCVRMARALALSEDQVTFVEDTQCSLEEEISISLAVLNTSRTEALPVTLIEAMAAGTPFVATPVGAVPSLPGGLLADGVQEQAMAVRRILDDADTWRMLSEEGRAAYERKYRRDHVQSSLADAVAAATGQPTSL